MPLGYLADSGLGDALRSFTFTKFIKKGFDLFFAQLRIFLSELPYELDNPYGYLRVLTLLGRGGSGTSPSSALHAPEFLPPSADHFPGCSKASFCCLFPYCFIKLDNPQPLQCNFALVNFPVRLESIF